MTPRRATGLSERRRPSLDSVGRRVYLARHAAVFHRSRRRDPRDRRFRRPRGPPAAPRGGRARLGRRDPRRRARGPLRAGDLGARRARHLDARCLACLDGRRAPAPQPRLPDGLLLVARPAPARGPEAGGRVPRRGGGGPRPHRGARPRHRARLALPAAADGAGRSRRCSSTSGTAWARTTSRRPAPPRSPRSPGPWSGTGRPSCRAGERRRRCPRRRPRTGTPRRRCRRRSAPG